MNQLINPLEGLLRQGQVALGQEDIAQVKFRVGNGLGFGFRLSLAVAADSILMTCFRIQSRVAISPSCFWLRQLAFPAMLVLFVRY